MFHNTENNIDRHYDIVLSIDGVGVPVPLYPLTGSLILHQHGERTNKFYWEYFIFIASWYFIIIMFRSRSNFQDTPHTTHEKMYRTIAQNKKKKKQKYISESSDVLNCRYLCGKTRICLSYMLAHKCYFECISIYFCKCNYYVLLMGFSEKKIIKRKNIFRWINFVRQKIMMWWIFMYIYIC